MFWKITNKIPSNTVNSIHNSLPSTSSVSDITDDDPDIPHDKPDADIKDITQHQFKSCTEAYIYTHYGS
uniref:Uncharacterized protein n=1 Tax=Octopus bimaculoides TaxID=37653 RepID=A0A0L8FWY5_OCTBM